jgi:hypothetical protein
MRRALGIALTAGTLVVGVAAPAAAAPPEHMKTSGSYANLSSSTEDCRQHGSNRTVCTNVNLYASTNSDGTGFVCVDTATYSISRDRFTLRSQENGCTDVPDSTLTVTDGFVATLAPTTLTLFSDGAKSSSRTVTVSAQDSPVGPVATSTGRGSFKDGTCTYRYSYSERSAPVTGTITLDGVTLDESGFAAVGSDRVTERCG